MDWGGVGGNADGKRQIAGSCKGDEIENRLQLDGEEHTGRRSCLITVCLSVCLSGGGFPGLQVVLVEVELKDMCLSLAANSKTGLA